MKDIFRGDNSTIAHYWANQNQYSAGNGSNFFYEDTIIYSYGHHFPIAKHVMNEERERGILFTQLTYSNTTAKHISIVRQSCNHLNVIYCKSPNATHADNFNFWTNKAESIASALLKAKKPEKYLNELHTIRTHALKYATFWGIAIPGSLSVVLDIQNKQQYTAYSENKQAIIEAEKKAAAAKVKKEHTKQLKKWLTGETRRLYVRIDQDYLRMNTSGEIETTQGVRINSEQARSFWKLIKDRKLNPGDIIANYTVDSVGDIIKIGCHAFPVDYLIKFGEKHFSKEVV